MGEEEKNYSNNDREKKSKELLNTLKAAYKDGGLFECIQTLAIVTGSEELHTIIDVEKKQIVGYSQAQIEELYLRVIKIVHDPRLH